MTTFLRHHRFSLLVFLSTLFLLPFVNGYPFFRDSGEFLTTLTIGGVAHPTGFPLDHVLAPLFLAIPLGSIPMRLAFMSALFGAVAIGFGFFVSSTAYPHSRGRDDPLHWLSFLLLPAALLCNTIWYHATNVEVYVPALGVSAAILACGSVLLVDTQSSRRGRVGPLFWLLGGLSLGMHITTVMVFGLVLLVVVAHRLTAREGAGVSAELFRFLLPGMLFALLGAVVLAYLPVRASMNPAVNWGNPAGPIGLLRHLTGQSIRTSFSQEMMQFDGGHILAHSRTYAEQLWRQVGLLLPLAAFGFWVLLGHRRSRWPGGLLAIVWFCDFAFSVFINPMAQKDLQTSTLSFWLVVVVASVGVMEVGRRVQGRFHRVAWVAGVLLVIAGWVSPFSSLSFTHRLARSSPIATAYGSQALRGVLPDGVLVSGGDDLSGISLYQDIVENRRPDVLPVIRQMLCEPSFAGPLLARYGKHAATPILDKSRKDKCGLDGEEQQMLEGWVAALQGFARERIPVAWEPGVVALESRMGDAVTAGFPTFGLTWRGNEETTGTRAFDAFERFRARSGVGEVDSIAGNIFAEFLRIAASHVLRRLPETHSQEALAAACHWLKEGSELSPDNCYLLNNLSVCRLRQGALANARHIAKRATQACPLHLNAHINLLRVQFMQKEEKEAIATLVSLSETFSEDPALVPKLKRMASGLQTGGFQAEGALLLEWLKRWKGGRVGE